ncbi:MAG: hypothetical protein DKT66_10885 [Candidatus Melainabacteria bacterium]|nr:MAG: hypothetical protein DKT66_10885 [Candidatus Melainabacteria bacterium]
MIHHKKCCCALSRLLRARRRDGDWKQHAVNVTQISLTVIAGLLIIKVLFLLAIHSLGLDVLKVVGMIALGKFILIPALVVGFQLFKPKTRQCSGGSK